MAICDLTTTGAVTASASASAMHQLRELLRSDSAFAQAMRASGSTEEAVRLAADHGIAVSAEAIWRNRGTLLSGGIPTWPG